MKGVNNAGKVLYDIYESSFGSIKSFQLLFTGGVLNSNTEKKAPAVVAILTGYIDIPSAFRAQRAKVPSLASEVVETTAPAPGTFGLRAKNGGYVCIVRNFFFFREPGRIASGVWGCLITFDRTQ